MCNKCWWFSTHSCKGLTISQSQHHKCELAIYFFMCMRWPQNNFSCPNLQVVEIHPAIQIVIQFTTGRDEHKSEPVPSPSPVLPQSLTKYWFSKGPNFMTVFFRTGKLQNDSYENTTRNPHLTCKFKIPPPSAMTPARQLFKGWISVPWHCLL